MQIQGYQVAVPLNTLTINIAGSFILAFILTFALEVREVNPDIRLGLTMGFLGAFTTFSALCKETVGLLQNGDYFFAISYITISIILGLGLAYVGIVLARKAGLKLINSKENITEIESEVE